MVYILHGYSLEGKHVLFEINSEFATAFVLDICLNPIRTGGGGGFHRLRLEGATFFVRSDVSKLET